MVMELYVMIFLYEIAFNRPAKDDVGQKYMDAAVNLVDVWCAVLFKRIRKKSLIITIGYAILCMKLNRIMRTRCLQNLNNGMM